MARVVHLTKAAAGVIRHEVEKARGNEVCFLAEVAENGAVKGPRVVARGHRSAVLAAVRDADWGDLVIHNHPSGELEPSDADLRVASELHAEGLGMAICDNAATELYVVLAPPREKELTLLDVDGIRSLLAPGGPVASRHRAYEDRPTQRDMSASVAETYNDGGVLLAEAGTGTGKSIAYLVPAVRWAVENRERTVVSTNTINLQEQLVTKDLPFLRDALDQPFRYALVKGRRNYISIRRARLAMDTGLALVEGAQARELAALGEWLESTEDGSLQDLPFEPSSEVWDEVESDSDVCIRTRCPHFEDCFYQNARRQAAGADVLVVNHHLLFSDLAVRRATGNYTAPAVLPPYRRVVLDEAHNLEDAATSHLGVSVSRRGLLRLLSRLDRRGRGVLKAVEERLLLLDAGRARQESLKRIERELRPDVSNAKQRAAELFNRLESVVTRSRDGVLRLGDGFDREPAWEASVSPALEDLLIVLERVARGLDGVRESILADRQATEKLEEQLVEVSALSGRVQAQADGLRRALVPGDDAMALVRWLERRGGGRTKEPNIVACAAPIELGQVLREALWEPADTAVLTSATLSTRDGFAFLAGRLGLDREVRVREQAYPSPFDFREQTVVAIPTDAPGLGRAHDDATAGAIADLAAASDGGIFGLFTSYRSLRSVAGTLRDRGVDRRWPLFVQGESPRGALVRRFTESGRGILLGVASFWEGVDVPGDPLRGLVIAKLPFRVPSEPLTAARMEALETDGGNGFFQYMLPHAALRLKQGFGRLIRSTADRGAVVLLDRRVLEKSYGRYFLDTLPPAPVRTGPWPGLREELRAFYSAPPDGASAAARTPDTAMVLGDRE
ncbi:MAG: helicase C-terminal domain-containing protein [Longimicrobiales bacterium]|nr:helicase C-terminal domain-containing protein [Longimicrobiales bacterium]